jgi:hypothetical protein
MYPVHIHTSCSDRLPYATLIAGLLHPSPPFRRSRMSFPLAEARILALFGESILYGGFILTCVSCWMTLLRRDRHTSHIRWGMITIAFVLFITATLHLALCCYQVISAFVFYEGPGGAIVPLADITSWDNVLTVCTSFLRCYLY